MSEHIKTRLLVVGGGPGDLGQQSACGGDAHGVDEGVLDRGGHLRAGHLGPPSGHDDGAGTVTARSMLARLRTGNGTVPSVAPAPSPG